MIAFNLQLCKLKHLSILRSGVDEWADVIQGVLIVVIRNKLPPGRRQATLRLTQ